MFLGVAGHAIDKRSLDSVDMGAVESFATVESVDLLLEVGGMDVDADVRVVGGGSRLAVAAQKEKVGNAQEIEVEQRIFRFLFGESGAMM